MDQEGKAKRINQSLSNAFKDYAQAAPPAELKKEVFNTLSALEFAADFVELFTTKFFQSELEFLNGFNTDKDPNQKD